MPRFRDHGQPLDAGDTRNVESISPSTFTPGDVSPVNGTSCERSLADAPAHDATTPVAFIAGHGEGTQQRSLLPISNRHSIAAGREGIDDPAHAPAIVTGWSTRVEVRL